MPNTNIDLLCLENTVNFTELNKPLILDEFLCVERCVEEDIKLKKSRNLSYTVEKHNIFPFIIL